VTEQPEAARRDDELFTELYPSLRRFAAAVRAPEEDPDDLVQEALTRALAIGPLSSRENPGAYLRTAIVRLASNQDRWLGRRRRAFTRAAATTDADRATYPSDLDDLRRLPPRDRAVLYLSLVEGYSYKEIAVMLGCSEQAARARASRAIRRLRVDLREEIADA
jgi:RNA polymerase sigma factor (sigma-70 family)